MIAVPGGPAGGSGGREAISICECWARDGLQGRPAVVPTTAKVRVLDAAVSAGVGEIDATSFVPARTVPQMADAEELLGRLPEGVKVRVVVVNLRGFERAMAVHRSVRPLDVIGFPISASEPHNIANLGLGHEAHQEVLEDIAGRCLAAGIEPLLSVSTAFGCPIAGAVDPAATLAFVAWGAERGIGNIMLGDTTGEAAPDGAFELFSTVRRRHRDVRFVAHFHDNRGRGIVNSMAAIEAGVRVVDSCLGGIGGEPPAVEQGQSGELGNVCTEDLVAMLDQMGIPTGIDVESLLGAGRLAEELLATRLGSRVLRAGLGSRVEIGVQGATRE